MTFEVFGNGWLGENMVAKGKARLSFPIAKYSVSISISNEYNPIEMIFDDPRFGNIYCTLRWEWSLLAEDKLQPRYEGRDFDMSDGEIEPETSAYVKTLGILHKCVYGGHVLSR